MEISNSSASHARMAALMRGCLHLNIEELNEDEFVEAWCQTKYYLETIHQVKFS